MLNHTKFEISPSIITTLPPSMKPSKCAHHGNEFHEIHDI